MVGRPALVLLLATTLAAQGPLDLPALLARLADPDWLWRPVLAGERCVQFSSYDRASDRGPGDPAAWYANHDRGQHLRTVERDGAKEFVMVDAAGPGCVARIWSANPSGTLHFDVDGQRVWSVDFALLCSGRHDGIPEPLAGVRAKGANCYLPIPFAESLVVSCTAGDCYYAFDVVQFAAGTRVVPFASDQLAGHRDAIAHAAAALDRRDWGGGRHATGSLPYGVPAGTVVVGFELFAADGVPREALASVFARSRLVVTCGGETTIDVPVLDFFAGGPSWTPWRGLALEVTPDGRARCRLPMPFPQPGTIDVITEGGRGGIELECVAGLRGAELPADALRFRASYHLAKGIPTRPFSDHLVLDAGGSGRFVGCSLLVRNPTRIWWGEGDEKFTVDGEAFPSWFGTGTEDYFGYAWCDPTPFQSPLHAQIACQGPSNFGFTQLHRLHVLDSVPFQRSFRFDLEVWHWVEDCRVDYATVAYWYGASGAASGLPPVPPAAERALALLPSPPVFVADRALEGEALRVVACSGGEHLVQDLSFVENTFSRDAHRWWRHGKVGDRLVLAVPVPVAGRYRVTMAMTRADDFALVGRSLGGHDLGAFDGFHTRVASSGPMDLGVHQLAAGEAELVFTLLGRNERSRPGMMVGLDWIRLERVE